MAMCYINDLWHDASKKTTKVGVSCQGDADISWHECAVLLSPTVFSVPRERSQLLHHLGDYRVAHSSQTAL